MVKSLILFLSSCILLCQCSGQPTTANKGIDCSSRFVQDSLVKVYIDNKADKLPGMYNNPAWQSYCDSILAICPNTAQAYQLKAVPYIKSGEYRKAMELVSKAVQVNPHEYTPYRGFLKCIFTKDYKGAIIDFQSAQKLMKNGYEMDHTYLFYQGLCNLELGNYPTALANFKQDIIIQQKGNPKAKAHFNTLLYMGILYYEMKNNALAEQYLQECLSQYSNHPDANYYLAMVYKREKNNAQKDKYLLQAKETMGKGYHLNEDNVYYSNYPHLVTLYEIEQEMNARE
jgi:tetratricopeptide (TPR) repeat protein